MTQEIISATKPRWGSLDPRPGPDSSPPPNPTRLARYIEGDHWIELDPTTWTKVSEGIIGEHPDLMSSEQT